MQEKVGDGSHLLGGSEVKLPGAQEPQLEADDKVSSAWSPYMPVRLGGSDRDIPASGSPGDRCSPASRVIPAAA